MVAFVDGNRALFHMAILGLPAVTIIHKHAVAAFLGGNGGDEIRDAVAGTHNGAGGGSEDVDPRLHRGAVGQGNVGAVVAIVAEGATGEIAFSGAGVAVDVMLDVTGLAEGAVNRPR